MTDESVTPPGKLALAISIAVVRRLASTTGRGPTKAKTTPAEKAGFMSDNHIDPDIAVEVFILEPLGAEPALHTALAAAEPVPE